MRGIFFEEEHARAAALALAQGGFSVEVVRERLAGEDDDADHPWAVLTDAPEIQLEVLVDTYDGWLDREEPEPTPRPVLPPGRTGAPPPPPPLPDAPRGRRPGP